MSSLQHAHLGSLAEESEEGSDMVSESDGGLIHDDDLPIESSPAASTSLDHPTAQGSARNSVTSGGAAREHKAAAAAIGTDGMFELDINDDFEQAGGVNSFTARGGQRAALYTTPSDLQKGGAVSTTAEAAQTFIGHAALNKKAASAPASVDGHQSSSGQAQYALQLEQAQHAQQAVSESSRQPLPDSVPAAALSPVPILGPVPEAAPLSAVAAASQPKATPVLDMAQVDLEEVELGEGNGAGPSAADEWEEVNLARAREMAVDAPSAAIPGDKVGPCLPVVPHQLWACNSHQIHATAHKHNFSVASTLCRSCTPMWVLPAHTSAAVGFCNSAPH